MSDLPELLRFVEFLKTFRTIERQIIVAGGGRNENDQEHSYEVAMIAWYVVKAKQLDLDLDLVIRYALVHDLVETYAGDIPFDNLEARKDKEENEKKALEKIKNTFPEFQEMYKLIEQYEKKEDEESKFVYALDKLIPIIGTYLDNGRTWKACDITFELLHSLKTKKISVSPEVQQYYNDLLVILEEKKDILFPVKSLSSG